MFEATLEAKFKTVFDVKKVSYSLPGESEEQECLFVEVESARNQVTDGNIKIVVQGKASMFANGDKLPFGYFAKKIAEHLSDTKDLFFFDIEANSRIYQNKVQRGFAFVYFFNSQYDPDLGTLNSIDIEVET